MQTTTGLQSQVKNGKPLLLREGSHGQQFIHGRFAGHRVYSIFQPLARHRRHCDMEGKLTLVFVTRESFGADRAGKLLCLC